MSAPDFKRICGACIYAAVGSQKPSAVAVASEGGDNENETPVVESNEADNRLWNELEADEQNGYISVAGFLHQFAGSRPLSQLDDAIAAEAVFNKFGATYAVAAVVIFKNVAQEFGHL